MELWVSLITQLGFPIAAAIAMAVFIWKIYKRSEVREDKLTEQLAESHKINADAIHALGEYNTRLSNIEVDVKTIKDNIIQGE